MFAVADKSEVLLQGTPFYPRSEARNPVKLSVVFRWKDANGAHEGHGITRDLSPKGIFVKTEFAPALKDIVRCYILLPSLMGDQTEELDLEATVVGRVVRTELSGDCGFAVAARVFVLKRI